MTRRAEAVVLTTVVALACASPAPEGAIVSRFLDHMNAGEVEAALDVWADDAVFTKPGQDPIRGTALRRRLQWDSAMGTRFIARSATHSGDTVFVTGIRETGVWLQLLGVGEIEWQYATFVTDDERITTTTFGPLTAGSQETLDDALADFLPWALHEYVERYRRVYDDDGFSYEARHTGDLISLLREWRAGDR